MNNKRIEKEKKEERCISPCLWLAYAFHESVRECKALHTRYYFTASLGWW
jgi:hypothetical protein